MPMYEYRCKDCGEAFEKLVSFNSQAEITCPKCGCTHVEKQVSGFALSGQRSTRSSSASSCAPSGRG